MMNLENGLVVTELPFGRALGETERAFGCFRAYLELGEERLWITVAEKTGVSFYTIKRWAWLYQWKKRVQAYCEWAEDGGRRTAADERSEVGGQKSGQMTEDGGQTTNDGGQRTEDGGRMTEDRGQRLERLAGERLRRAAERALERFGCERQARKVGLGEIARTLVAAFRMGRPESEKGKGAEKPWLTPEEEAAIDREFMAAADRIVAIEEQREIEDRGPKTEDRQQTTDDGGQRTEEKRDVEDRGPMTEDRQRTTEDGRRTTENRESVDGGRRTEDGLMGVEDRGPRTEDRQRTTGDGPEERSGVSGQKSAKSGDGGRTTEDGPAEAGTLTISGRTDDPPSPGSCGATSECKMTNSDGGQLAEGNGEGDQGSQQVPVSAAPSGVMAGSAAPIMGRKKKPAQYTVGRREWVQRKHGVVVG